MVIVTEKQIEFTPLIDKVSRAFIIAYKEPTEQLSSCLQKEGFNCETLRQVHKEEYRDYSPSYLCLLNHCQAWKRVIESGKLALIVEADFVPVEGLARLPLPFPPEPKNLGIAWLYTCAPQIYTVSPEGFANGFSASTVAYIVGPEGAKVLLSLEESIGRNPGPKAYSSWDSTLDEILRKHSLKNYLPFRNYGEHGGLPNLEHHRHNLSKVHRADVLYGPLAFIPLYAQSDNNQAMALLRERFGARVKGIGRLLLGKYLRPAIVRRHPQSARFIGFALRRQLTLRL